MAETIYQAESALLSGVTVVSGNGAEGTGYADYQNPLGDFIEWTITVPTAGNYDLSWRYANGKSNRPLSFEVNDTVIDNSLDFEGTGDWDNWEFTSQLVYLQAGTNTVRLTANGSSGANFDYLRVSESTATIPVNVIISDAVATEGTDDFLVFDVGLSAPSSQNISLELSASANSAKGGLISDFGNDSAGDPVDYGDRELEFSADSGNTWQPAVNGTQVTFAAGQTNLKVRLAVNDDIAEEGTVAETINLEVVNFTGALDDTSDKGIGSIIDNDNTIRPDQVHLAWVDDPATTMTVVWRTHNLDTVSLVEYRIPGQTEWQTAIGSLRSSGTTGTLHEVTLTSLNPNTSYEYRVQGDNSLWSDVYTTQTAPTLGTGDFTAIYVADTGLIGREDGLATGTQQIIEEIDKLDPLLILGGGDYAYFNTDDRFPTLDDAIDEWFVQWEPVLSSSPILPTYGNHEIRLGEGYQPWADRFPTPEGLNNRRHYSFDVGDVHFVSILSQEERKGLTDTELDWIEQDIIAAQQQGQRWIIPYLHAGPFGEGLNHPSNQGVRQQLVPLFESLDVDLVIYSHDQSYERTYPLMDTYDPTSTSLTDYTKEDGVVYVKTSPGGKISNKNGDFSPFPSETLPSYMAFRDNTMHHFSQLSVFDEGYIRLDTYGVVGDGSTPVIIDSFQIVGGPEPLFVNISDASAIEGVDDLLVFELSLTNPSDETITLDLAVTDGTAKGGSTSDFGIDSAGDPVDYSDRELEVSADGGSTWQSAVNGTQVTFAAGQTNLKVRLAVNDDDVDEGITDETMTIAVKSVVAGSVDSTSDIGTGFIVDNDGSAGLEVVYQAEDALLSGVSIASGNGAEGRGYADYQNSPGDFIEWTTTVPTAGNYELSWRYANRKSNRPLDFSVNGATIDSSLDFEKTGGWDDWEFVNQTVALQAGENKVRLTSNGSGANFDYLKVTEVSTTVPIDVTIADAIATEGIDDFLVFDVSLSSISNEDITLDLATTDISAKGGLISDFVIDPEGDPVDYANQELEVSADNGNTWQSAVNGTQVTFAAGQTNLKVRLAVNDDGAEEGNNRETATLGVKSVIAGTVNNISDTGTGSIVDNDGSNGSDGSAGSEAIYQAEDALLSGVAIESGNGAEGTGYADYQNSSGDFIEWTTTVPSAGNYELSWRYANGKSNRPLGFSLNGSTIDSSLDFEKTGGWSKWGFVNQTLALQAGTNTVRLTANGSSGANFDYLEVREVSTTVPIDVTIADAIATEGNDFLIFDVSLSSTSTEDIILDLATTDITAKGGLISDFVIDPEGDPVDYGDRELEFSNDNGSTWQSAVNGTQITFAAGQTDIKVRLAVNNDRTDEGIAGETMTLAVAGVVAGTVNNIGDTGTGSIVDNDGSAGTAGTPISILPFTEVRVEGNLTLDFDGNDGGFTDKDGEGIGFTMVDPGSNSSNPNPILGIAGYWPEKLNVTDGNLQIETTSGLQFLDSNSLDNALGFGLNVPSKLVKLETGLIDLPTPVGGSAQAGLWFGRADSGGDGTSEDNYIKLAVRSNKNGNYLLEAFMEEDGSAVSKATVDIPESADIDLSLFIDPIGEKVTAQYSVAGGSPQTLKTFNNVPAEWFSFDQAGINPEIATRSFGGIFASHRNASSPQVFTFDNFAIAEDELPPATQPPTNSNSGDIDFDRWSIPVNNATDMAFGPDGKLYVATLFGDIHAIAFDPVTQTVISNEVIDTIKTDEGGNRLTLGIDVDPDSTAENVILWVGHSDGSINNGGLNSGKISRLSGPGFSQNEDVVTGIPRAIANHATNNIEFAPDGKLYIYQGGNTGAGSANTATSEFGDRPEQPLSAALLVVDIPQWKANPNTFNGDVASPIGEFIDEFYTRKEQELGRPFTEVQVYASGLRNTYDGVFHSNGYIYAPDNGLGVTGTVPPVPRLGNPSDRNVTTLLGSNSSDNPGTQADPLNLIVEGGYYGHPNPYRDEVVFQDGSFQSLPADPNYQGHLDLLGKKLSANGIVEYTADNFFGQLQGDLLITNFSSGDNITRVQLSGDGTAVTQKSSLTGGFSDPLPIEMGPDGTVFVGEFNGGKITVLDPRGIWRNDLPTAPDSVLDAGSAVLNGNIYAIGGKTASGHVSSVYIYDPGNSFIASDDLWTSAADLPGVAVENPAVVALDDEIYAFGGSTGPFSGAVNSTAVYDPDLDSWTSIAPMPTARGGATAEVVNGDIYVIGGMDINGASVDVVEIYDPETDTWTDGPSLQIRRDNPGSAVVDDLLYVFGGRTRNGDGSVVDGDLSSMEIFDPASQNWNSGASLITGRRTFAVGTADNKIQVIGGEGNNVFNQNEEYDPLTNQWRSLPAIPTPRHGAAFGTIDDIIYVAGGGDSAGSSFTNVVEAFDV